MSTSNSIRHAVRYALLTSAAAAVAAPDLAVPMHQLAPPVERELVPVGGRVAGLAHRVEGEHRLVRQPGMQPVLALAGHQIGSADRKSQIVL